MKGGAYCKIKGSEHVVNQKEQANKHKSNKRNVSKQKKHAKKKERTK
jgi:hypothetical protein